MSDIKLTIDGKEVTAKKGDTVLEAARNAGIKIPTLCAHPALEPYGSCRLCIVHIENVRGNPTSCTTPATDGMVVNTKTDDIVEMRREILKLMLSGHTSPCLVCLHREACEKYRRPFKSGKATRCTFCSRRDDCELRALSFEHGIEEFELPIIYKNMEVEKNDPFMDRDYNLCVLCGRCARICKKLHGKGAIEFTNRGCDARIGTAFERPHTDTNCKFCGACVEICPVGAMTDRYAKWYGAPDAEETTTCTLCPIGCTVKMRLKDGELVACEMTELTPEAKICAIGRFVLPQLLDNPLRNKFHFVRIEDGLIKASYEDAVAGAAEKLGDASGDEAALIIHGSATNAELYLMEKFTKEVLKSDNFAVAKETGGTVSIEPASVADAVKGGKIKLLITTGDYFTAEELEKVDTLISSDLYLSDAVRSNAEVIFAAADLAEISGSFKTASGETKRLTSAAKRPDDTYAECKLICDIAVKMGAEGFNFDKPEDIRKEMEKTGFAPETPAAPAPSPIDEVRALPRTFRGHLMKDIVSALQDLMDLSCKIDAPAEETPEAPVDDSIPFRIIEKTEIVPNTHMATVLAPEIAEKCQPGQFVIAMVNETSERTPYSISDFDREAGTITMVTLELGRSSRAMAQARQGDHLAHLVGPLGMPIDVKNYGTVVVGGGCYGVGAILPLARALKEAGNKVIAIEEVSSHYLTHWEDKLTEASDEFIIVSKDGSVGMKGGVQEVISMLNARGEKIDQSFIIGCTFMMMMVSDVNKEFGIPTQTAMNPLMLDGTGMCGACRVTEGENTKFACVDGPFLDGLQIDWIELLQRKTAFTREEVQSLPQRAVQPHKHEGGCGICD